MIYFIEEPISKLIKIGYSKHYPWHRLTDIQQYHGAELVPLGVLPGSAKKEASLHKTFASLRVNGEWFRGELSLKAFIKDHCKPFPKKTDIKPKPKPQPNLTKQLVDLYGWTREQLAYRVGCTSRSVENWYGGKTKPIGIFQRKLERLYKQEEAKGTP